MGVYEYLLRLKLSAAAEKLQSSDQTIQEIALEFGFENPASFSRSFKKIMEVSPKLFRG